LDNSNQIIEKTIREIKESHADKETTKQLRSEIADYKEQMTATVDTPLLPLHPKPIGSQKPFEKRQKQRSKNDLPVQKKEDNIVIDTSSPIKVGDFVRLQETATIGKVANIKNNQAVVAFDSVSMRLEINRLEKIKNYQPPQRRRPNFAGVMSDLNERKAQFTTTLDLRGIRAEEALQMTEKYLDEAILLSIKQLRILHGKGNGILRNLIRGMLAKNANIEHFEDEFVETGGTGITIVALR
ncbi:MAG: Smr/MutS family protein, partial [Bacteroidales bacterium]|nr:Smr/MutS family protein [Bacteroidales bacterium]